MTGIVNPTAVVLGAAGTIGSGVVGALLEVGSPVLAVGPAGPRMQALAEQFVAEPGLQRLEHGCITNDAQAAALALRLRERGQPLGAVFACIGTPLQGGKLLDQPTAVLQQRLESDLLPHLAAARHLLPLLAEASTPGHYILIGGPTPQRGWSGYGHASVNAAATQMLVQVLHEEALAIGVRVQMLAVSHPVSHPANARHACIQWPSALAVGRRAVALMKADGQRPEAIVPFTADNAPCPSGLLFPPPLSLSPA